MLDCFFSFFFLVYAGWDEGVAQVSVCLYFTIFMWGWEGEGGGVERGLCSCLFLPVLL